MKHIKPPVPAEVYYYNRWRSNAFGGIMALILALAGLIWSAVMGFFYQNATAAIASAVGSVFWFFVMAIRFRDASTYYDRYLRAACNPSIINSDHVNQ